MSILTPASKAPATVRGLELVTLLIGVVWVGQSFFDQFYHPDNVAEAYESEPAVWWVFGLKLLVLVAITGTVFMFLRRGSNKGIYVGLLIGVFGVLIAILQLILVFAVYFKIMGLLALLPLAVNVLHVLLIVVWAGLALGSRSTKNYFAEQSKLAEVRRAEKKQKPQVA